MASKSWIYKLGASPTLSAPWLSSSRRAGWDLLGWWEVAICKAGGINCFALFCFLCLILGDGVMEGEPGQRDGVGDRCGAAGSLPAPSGPTAWGAWQAAVAKSQRYLGGNGGPGAWKARRGPGKCSLQFVSWSLCLAQRCGKAGRE